MVSLSRLPQTYNPYGIPHKQDAHLSKALESIKITTQQKANILGYMKESLIEPFSGLSLSQRGYPGALKWNLKYHVITEHLVVLFRMLNQTCGEPPPSSTQSISCLNEGDLA